jgi:hypothetical protein
MSKTYSEQVEKAVMLAEGVKNNFNLVKDKGISMDDIELLLKQAKEVKEASEEVDELRANLSAKSAVAQKKLADIKNQMLAVKRIIKMNFDQLKWQKFGIADKR